MDAEHEQQQNSPPRRGLSYVAHLGVAPSCRHLRSTSSHRHIQDQEARSGRPERCDRPKHASFSPPQGWRQPSSSPRHLRNLLCRCQLRFVGFLVYVSTLLRSGSAAANVTLDEAPERGACDPVIWRPAAVSRRVFTCSALKGAPGGSFVARPVRGPLPHPTAVARHDAADRAAAAGPIGQVQ